jgi:TIR domain
MIVDLPKVFFSYSHADTEFVLKLANDLRLAGVSPWIDQLDIPPGARWDSAVENALMASPCLLVVLSPASVASQNVLDEVAFALGNNKKVVPVLHSRCAIPFRIQRLQYIDFTATYNNGFAQLLSALNVVQPLQTIQALAPAARTSKAASDIARSEPVMSPHRLIYLLIAGSLATGIGISYWLVKPHVLPVPLFTPAPETLPAHKPVLLHDASQEPVGARQQPSIAPQRGVELFNGHAQEDAALPSTRSSEPSESRVQGSSTNDHDMIFSIPDKDNQKMANPIQANKNNRSGKIDDWLFGRKGK